MSVYTICFSPTGGTEKAARILASSLSDDVKMFDLTDTGLRPTALGADSGAVAVIAMPSYGGRVPGLAAERLKNLRGGGMPCVLLCVYGNRAYEDTLVEMADLAGQCGFRVIAAVAAVAEHSIMHQYATGRPDRTDTQNLKQMGAKIAEKLAQGNMDEPSGIPGSRPYKNAGGTGLVPKAASACVSCGLCAEACPAGAIDKGDPKSVDAKKCISCMRCVAKCPHKARKLNGMMVSAAALAMKKVCSVRKECELYL